MTAHHMDFFGRWIGISAHRLTHLVTRTLQKEGYDLTHEQLVLLFIISNQKGINQKELARRLDRDKTSIARSLAKLERDQRIVRVHTDNDKRVNHIYLTPQGTQLLEEIGPLFQSVREELKKGFLPEEIDTVVDFLKRLTEKVVEMEKEL